MRRSYRGYGRMAFYITWRRRRGWNPGTCADDCEPVRTLQAVFGGNLLKGDAMKRYALIVCAALGVVLSSGMARASWGSCTYSGYQPWWNIFACRNKCMTCEEERLQHFWRDYYDAMRRYYKSMEHIDWVAYYKNHGYQINAGCAGPNGGPCRINYAPVFVSPTMQWAVPGACGGAANGPAGCAGYGAPTGN